MAHAPPGHHSVVGRPSVGSLSFPEYVVYRGEQVNLYQYFRWKSYQCPFKTCLERKYHKKMPSKYLNFCNFISDVKRIPFLTLYWWRLGSDHPTLDIDHRWRWCNQKENWLSWHWTWNLLLQTLVHLLSLPQKSRKYIILKLSNNIFPTFLWQRK